MMENVQKNPAAATLVYIPGFLLLGGGVPIKVGNEVIGAVGVAAHRAAISTRNARWTPSPRSRTS